jgi:hypothetical protein
LSNRKLPLCPIFNPQLLYPSAFALPVPIRHDSHGLGGRVPDGGGVRSWRPRTTEDLGGTPPGSLVQQSARRRRHAGESKSGPWQLPKSVALTRTAGRLGLLWHLDLRSSSLPALPVAPGRHVRHRLHWRSVRHGHVVPSRCQVWPFGYSPGLATPEPLVSTLEIWRGGGRLGPLTRRRQWRLQRPSRHEPLQQLGQGPGLRRHSRHLVSAVGGSATFPTLF